MLRHGDQVRDVQAAQEVSQVLRDHLSDKEFNVSHATLEGEICFIASAVFCHRPDIPRV